MLSPARTAANAANAQLSTGPKTEEGKARVSQNARKHGLTARDLVVPDDQKEEFDELLADHTVELAPIGVIEQTIFNQLVRAAWDLRRIGRMEAGLCQNGVDPLADESKRAEVERLARYHSRIERSYYRALRELRIAQTNRGLRDAYDPNYEESMPELADVSQVTKQSQRESVQEKQFFRLAQTMDRLLPTLVSKNAPGQLKPTAQEAVKR